jgi:predicted ATP-grasp superfamily ATP-dependent carboligase
MSPAIEGTIRGNDRKSVSILLSEGSSLSARQTITALGPLGYVIDVCDSNPLCISRFSRFVRHFYRCPAWGANPKGYFDFIIGRLEEGRYDVLLPVHEQAYLFARTQDQLKSKTGLALTRFDNFALLQSKATFARLLAELGLPQPWTRFVHTRTELETIDGFPYYVKTPYSTAGQGVWRVENAAGRSGAIDALEQRGLLDGQTDIVVQDVAPGTVCQAQTVFEHGRLIAVHCTTQWAAAVGGGHAARMGVDHPIVRSYVERLGQHLQWHGALAVDYLFEPITGQPYFIEANPRLVEPMNATLSGVNLADILVRLSLGESFEIGKISRGRFGIRSHGLISILLGVADRGASRSALMSEILRALCKRRQYSDSEEDLTPITQDPLSVFPLALVCLHLMLNPKSVHTIAGEAVSAYSLTPGAIEIIRNM